MVGKQEKVIIQVDECALTLLPAFGGKIGSLRVGECELLQAPLQAYALRTETMAFSEGDASGWDECLPSVAACSVDTEAGEADVPDHGDLWRVVWKIIEVTSDSVTLRADCFSLPLQLTRSVTLSTTDSGWRLRLRYSLENTGEHAVPFAWTAHPLFAVCAGDRIVLPAEVKSLRLEGSGGGRLGKNGDSVAWPMAALANGPSDGLSDDARDDLSLAKEAGSEAGDKLFTGVVTEGWCSLDRPSVGMRLKVSFDPALTPYIGLWLCYGGWPEAPGPKQMCVALEPSTTPVDSLAECCSGTGTGARMLGPGESFNWPMELEIDRI